MGEQVDVLGVVIEPIEPIEEAAEAVVVEEQSAEEASGEKVASPAAEEESAEQKREKGQHLAFLAERRKRQELEAELVQLRAQQPQAKQPAALVRPQRDAFQTTEAYEDALLDFGDRRREIKQAQEAEQRSHVETARSFDKRADDVIIAGEAAYPDFTAVINGGLGPYLTPALHQALVQAGGHEVAYHLGKNPGEAARLSQLSPLEMAVEIGGIKRDLKTTPKPKAAIPQTLTQARSASGQFEPAWSGPKPLDEIFTRKP